MTTRIVRVGKAGQTPVEVVVDTNNAYTYADILKMGGIAYTGATGIKTSIGSVQAGDFLDDDVTAVSVSAPKIEAGASIFSDADVLGIPAEYERIVRVGKAGARPVEVTIVQGKTSYREALCKAGIAATPAVKTSIGSITNIDAQIDKDVTAISTSAPKIEAGN